MNFLDFLKNNTVYLDGGMGTLLEERGLLSGELPERLNLTKPEEVTAIHKAYFDAGSNVVAANTFGANSLKYCDAELEKIISAALENARRAREESENPEEKFIALDIGPSGKLLAPLGDFDFEDAVELFAKTVRLGVKYGAELVIVETMNDSYETKAALLAVKENSTLPVIVTNVYGSDGKLMTGADAAAMVFMLEAMGADAIGANCSLGPSELLSVAKELTRYASVPVVMKPNAGLPKVENGKTVFKVESEEFADCMLEMFNMGVRVLGGCCGTTPRHIKALTEKTTGLSPIPLSDKNISAVSSYTHAVIFGNAPVLIGERINPTGKKRFKQALLEKDIGYILNEGVRQEECGAHILDVNVGLPEIDEAELLSLAVKELQAVSDLPLQIDSSDPVAMERAIRRYNGKAMVNSVNGKAESMEAVFPLVKKYGAAVVALTLDENGIPDTADGRVEIAKKIISRAKEYGIEKKDIIFDTLTLTVSAEPNAAKVTLEALRRIRYELGCHTSLGVSNVSFGLPSRDTLNSAFFSLALASGLSAAIMNPYSQEMMKTYYSYLALTGLDEGFKNYISKAEGFAEAAAVAAPLATPDGAEKFSSRLVYSIIKGLKEEAACECKKMLLLKAPLEVVEEEIIPALNSVGESYEAKKLYLPSLLMSAEAANSAFEIIKCELVKSNTGTPLGETVIMATVEGDIHDIGKNIVKLILQNYGFNVVDLGKDVSSLDILEAAIRHKAKIVGLSALMTTTVPAMQRTIELLREKAPSCKIMVGGAVLTPEYAKTIGADAYAKDAMEAVRVAKSLLKV